MSAIKERNSSIELLRIFAAFAVVILHYNNPIGFESADRDSINWLILNGLESISISAVNVFILITGYFLCLNNKRNLNKPLSLIIQVILYKQIANAVKVAVGVNNFTIGSVVSNCIPSNYFIIIYITLYFLSPYVNICLNNLSRSYFKKLIIMLLLMFSIWPLFVDILSIKAGGHIIGLDTVGIYGCQMGYTIVHFVLVYCIGAYIRLHGFELKRKVAFIIFIISSLFILGSSLFELKSGKGLLDVISYYYYNPLVIIQSVSAFALSLSFVFCNSLVNKLAKAALCCFLLQFAIFPILNIGYFVKQEWYVYLAHCMGSMIIIFVLSYAFNNLYEGTIGRIINRVNIGFIEKPNDVHKH